MVCLNKIPLFNEQCAIYTGGICHQEFLIFLDPNNCQVVIFSKCLKKIGTIKTDMYQSITENKKECCFILTKENDKKFLYKTTYDFLEFDSIELHIPDKYKAIINDIYYDEENRQIFVVTDYYVYAVTTDGYFIKEISSHILRNSNVVIQNLNGCYKKVCVPTDLQSQYTAIGQCGYLYLTEREKGNVYLKILGEDNCLIDSMCLGSGIKVVSIFVCCDILYLLIIKNNRYSYLCETDIICKCCKEECTPCCKCWQKADCNHKCCENPTGCLLESVALVEAALSHILNAEGEKIQKAIADGANICELLEINHSVTESIFNVTMLEHVLQKKLENALQYDKYHNCCHDFCD